MSLYADDITEYIENPKDFIQKLLKLINEFSKVAKYEINTQKLVAFLYTNNEISEMEYQKKFLFLKFFNFGHACSIWKFLGQRQNPYHSSYLGHCSKKPDP